MAQSATIVLVEDYEPLRRIWSNELGRRGHLVLPAETGSAALAVLRELDGCPDLMVVDLGLPDMSGRAFVHHAAKIHPGFQVLYISGRLFDRKIRRDALRVRQNFMQKPFSITALERRVNELLPPAIELTTQR